MLDLGLPGCGGLEALARVKAAYPEAAVVVFSACDDGRTVREALRAGARGYIPKTTPGPRMLIALQRVAEGGVYVPPEAMAERKAEASSLPERQLEVLRLLGRGHSNRRIARAMGLSETTVKHHVSAILKALGASSRTEAIVVAPARSDFRLNAFGRRHTRPAFPQTTGAPSRRHQSAGTSVHCPFRAASLRSNAPTTLAASGGRPRCSQERSRRKISSGLPAASRSFTACPSTRRCFLPGIRHRTRSATW